MPGGSQPAGSTNVTQTTQPWAGIQPYLKTQFQGALQGLGNIGSTPGNPANGNPATSPSNAVSGSGTLADFMKAHPGMNAATATYQWQQQPKSTPQTTQPSTATAAVQPGFLAPQAFPGEQVAPFSPQTQAAMNLTTQRALQGSPINDAASGLLTNTLNGGMLNSNPYLDNTYNQAAQAVTGSLNGSFGQGGRYGSGLNQQTLGNSLGNLATGIYGQNYQDERARQMQGLLVAPQTANQGYADAGQLANVGAQQDAQTQAKINEAIGNFNINQQAPYTALSRYAGLLQGNYGNTSTQTQPYFTNPTGNMLGTGLGLLSGANSLNNMGGMSGLLGAFGMGGASNAPLAMGPFL